MSDQLGHCAPIIVENWTDNAGRISWMDNGC